MSLTKNITAALSIIRAKVTDTKAPLVASIIPTNRCNLRCPYCSRWERPGPELGIEQWEDIIDQLGAIGSQRLSVTGGEPLLFKQLDRILDCALSFGMKINLNTNGVLAPAKIDTIERVHSVTVSLDGDRSVHDAIRGVGTYQAAIAAAAVAIELEKELSFYTVLSKNNLDQLEHVVRAAEQMKGKAFFQPGTYFDFDGIKKNPEAPEVRKYREAIDRLIDMKKEGFPLGNSLSGLKYIRQWPGEAPLECFGSKLFVRIEADGNLRHCGRDGAGEPNSVLDGLSVALERMSAPPCNACWSAARVEFNLVAKGDLGAIFNLLAKG